ncbi:MAG: hypothetical protein ACM30H_06610 [Clostridia bacterium]
MRILLALLFLSGVAGCANYGAGLVPGQATESDVVVAMGQPTAVKDSANGDRTLWYSKLPFGRENWAARLDAHGTLVSFDQRLTERYMAQLKPNVMTTNDVFELLGPPYRESKMPLKDRAVWEYPVRIAPNLQTLYVEFSSDGVLRDAYRLYDETREDFFFGFGL